MSTDIEKRIRQIEEIVEENNEMLRKIRRKETWNFWFNIAKILIFLGVFYYGYLFIQPFLQQLFGVYTSIKETADTANEIKGGLNFGLQDFDLSQILNNFSN